MANVAAAQYVSTATANICACGTLLASVASKVKDHPTHYIHITYAAATHCPVVWRMMSLENRDAKKVAVMMPRRDLLPASRWRCLIYMAWLVERKETQWVVSSFYSSSVHTVPRVSTCSSHAINNDL